MKIDKEAGYKRKELGNKLILAIKNFWYNWFGDLKILDKFKKLFNVSPKFIVLILTLASAKAVAKLVDDF